MQIFTRPCLIDFLVVLFWSDLQEHLLDLVAHLNRNKVHPDDIAETVSFLFSVLAGHSVGTVSARGQSKCV
jgi:hypothetical protein